MFNRGPSNYDNHPIQYFLASVLHSFQMILLLFALFFMYDLGNWKMNGAPGIILFVSHGGYTLHIFYPRVPIADGDEDKGDSMTEFN